MIAEAQGTARGWNPSVMQAAYQGSEVSGESEALRAALYRSWFADDSSDRSNACSHGVRQIAWTVPEDFQHSGGCGPAELYTASA